MEWLLIFYVSSSHKGGINSERFSTQKECIYIAKEHEKLVDSWTGSTRYKCVKVKKLERNKDGK